MQPALIAASACTHKANDSLLMKKACPNKAMISPLAHNNKNMSAAHRHTGTVSLLVLAGMLLAIAVPKVSSAVAPGARNQFVNPADGMEFDLLAPGMKRDDEEKRMASYVIDPILAKRSPYIVDPILDKRADYVIDPILGKRSGFVMDPEMESKRSSSYVVDPILGKRAAYVVDPILSKRPRASYVVDPILAGKRMYLVDPIMSKRAPGYLIDPIYSKRSNRRSYSYVVDPIMKKSTS